MNPITKKAIIIFAAIALIASIGTILAVTYTYPQSNALTGTGSSRSITVNTVLSGIPTSYTEGDSITWTATLSQPQSGITIVLYDVAGAVYTPVNSAITDANGVATTSFQGQVGTHTYVAKPNAP